MTAGLLRKLKPAAKAFFNGVSLVLVSPAALCSELERRLSKRSESLFLFWAHVLSVLPGTPGVFLRRAYYRMTLEGATLNFFVGFGALFTHRSAVVENDVYIGPYALVGSVHLGEGTLVGSRASLLSGSEQHVRDEQGRWQPFDPDRIRQIRVGPRTWIGEGAIITADVGAGSMVGAGTVVTSAVRPGVAVAGNPARFVRNLSWAPDEPGTPAADERGNGESTAAGERARGKKTSAGSLGLKP